MAKAKVKKVKPNPISDFAMVLLNRMARNPDLIRFDTLQPQEHTKAILKC